MKKLTIDWVKFVQLEKMIEMVNMMRFDRGITAGTFLHDQFAVRWDKETVQFRVSIPYR